MPKENMSKLGIHRVTCQKVFLKTFKKLDLIGTTILTPLPTHPPHTHTHTHIHKPRLWKGFMPGPAFKSLWL